MPYYRILLIGEGIRICDVDNSEPIVGFVTTRAIRAASVKDAIEKAKEKVLADWEIGQFRDRNTGSQPKLDVEEVYSDHFFGNLFFRANGYIFYSEDRK